MKSGAGAELKFSKSLQLIKTPYEVLGRARSRSFQHYVKSWTFFKFLLLLRSPLRGAEPQLSKSNNQPNQIIEIPMKSTAGRVAKAVKLINMNSQCKSI